MEVRRLAFQWRRLCDGGLTLRNADVLQFPRELSVAKGKGLMDTMDESEFDIPVRNKKLWIFLVVRDLISGGAGLGSAQSSTPDVGPKGIRTAGEASAVQGLIVWQTILKRDSESIPGS
jgi:hypothetical protein